MTHKHTPAPWFAVDYAGTLNIQDGPTYEDRNVLSYDKIWNENTFCKETVEANAALMVIAPDMFEHLEAIADGSAFCSETGLIWEHRLEAIKLLLKTIS